ncbi:hypothetical protein G7Y79_00023g053110 [Physcia stellaris]|nr:hypothetical protein G7Y79_00023g053110 [Physcia stellaris]
MSNTPTPPIVRFYDPHLQATDAQGRDLATILSWSDTHLEYSHDYIQTLFPLPERSPIDPSAPVINRATFTAFRSRPELRSQLRESLKRICQFYGFHIQDNNDAFTVERQVSRAYEARARNWVTRFNHNHLRITRIIRSLRVLGLNKEAKAFFDAVKNVHDETGRISDRSLMFWTRAMERPLYLAPEDEEDEGMGKDFLYEFEEQENTSENDRESEETMDGSGEENGKYQHTLQEDAPQGKIAETKSDDSARGLKRPREGDEATDMPPATPHTQESRLNDGTPTNSLQRTKPKNEEI